MKKEKHLSLNKELIAKVMFLFIIGVLTLLISIVLSLMTTINSVQININNRNTETVSIIENFLVLTR